MIHRLKAAWTGIPLGSKQWTEKTARNTTANGRARFIKQSLWMEKPVFNDPKANGYPLLDEGGPMPASGNRGRLRKE
jgi:hypothetical protein